MTKSPNQIQCQIQFLFISAKLMSLSPTLSYSLDSDWITQSIGGIKLWFITVTKFDVLDGKIHV